MKNSDIPVRLLNNESETVADAQECDNCGFETEYGHYRDGGRWFCQVCYLEYDDDVNVAEQSAICECGVETAFTKSYQGESCYICPRCQGVFTGEPCPECGDLCVIEHTAGGFSGCTRCVDLHLRDW